jgi:hypothetical protein
VQDQGGDSRGREKGRHRQAGYEGQHQSYRNEPPFHGRPLQAAETLAETRRAAKGRTVQPPVKRHVENHEQGCDDAEQTRSPVRCGHMLIDEHQGVAKGDDEHRQPAFAPRLAREIGAFGHQLAGV